MFRIRICFQRSKQKKYLFLLFLYTVTRQAKNLNTNCTYIQKLLIYFHSPSKKINLVTQSLRHLNWFSDMVVPLSSARELGPISCSTQPSLLSCRNPGKPHMIQHALQRKSHSCIPFLAIARGLSLNISTFMRL
jgi:hypothetical protein